MIIPSFLSNEDKTYVLETWTNDLERIAKTGGPVYKFNLDDQHLVAGPFQYPFALTSHVLYQGDKPLKIEAAPGTETTLKGFFVSLNDMPEFIDAETGIKKVDHLFLMLGRKPDEPGPLPAGARPHFTKPYLTIIVLGIMADGTFKKDPVTLEPIAYEYLTPSVKDANEEVEKYFPSM